MSHRTESKTSHIAYRPPKLYGIFGCPVAHSLSPLMHNRAFADSGFNGIFLPFEVTDIEAAVAALRQLGIQGVSVTIPHKVRVMTYLDALDAPARSIGAVNTIVNRNGRLKGYNSDSIGAVRALCERLPLDGKQVALIGAGGAAKAIGHGVQQAGGRIAVLNRTVSSGERLAAELQAPFFPLAEAGALACEILINATPVGMHPGIHDTPVPRSVFRPGMTVMDIVYTPLKTRFLREAEESGCKIIDGLSMFVYQGAFQFELWTGLKAPLERMRKTVLDALTLQQKDIDENTTP